jgi:exonuclease VII small subunit
MDVRSLQKAHKKIEDYREKVGKLRDEGRDLVDSLEAIVYTLDTACEDFNNGLDYLKTAIDSLSEQA